MQTSAIKFYSLEYNNLRTYLVAAIFILGNIVLPQICHLFPMGGVRWLPIYFFTLIGAYKYGWRVGLLTAIMSPLVNSIFFGMPATAALPAIMLKSTLLAGIAGYAAARFQKVSILLLASVVFAYQLAGTLGEWLMGATIYNAFQDFRIGIPGILTQILGGWAVINFLLKK